VSPILVITFLMTLLCLYLQVDIGAHYLGEGRELLKYTVVNQPLAVFEPGRQISFDNNIIYIEDRVGENGIKGVQIFTKSKDGKRVMQDITAKKGKIEVDKNKQILTVILFDCIVIDKTSQPETRLFNKKVEFSINYGQEFNRLNVGKRPKYMTMKELLSRIRIDKKLNRATTDLEVELNQRIAFALSPMAFLLLGLPLAIRTSRRETSINLFLSIILAGAFFLTIIIFESMTTYPQIYPQYLLWLPNLIYQITGAVLIARIASR
jgi:lipopolysaccharide export system permease protein